MAYAEGTTVDFEKSIAEIITLIKRAGAKRIGQEESEEHFLIQFAIHDRLIRFTLPLPGIDSMPSKDGRGSALNPGQRREKLAAAHRQRGRALLLVIKAKLESVESGIETFEQAFLANVVMADNRTVYERVAEPIALEYQTQQVQALALPAPRREHAS